MKLSLDVIGYGGYFTLPGEKLDHVPRPVGRPPKDTPPAQIPVQEKTRSKHEPSRR